MASVSQDRRNIIAERLNTRPRKRLDYLTPEEACELFRVQAVLHVKVDPAPR
jgi:IS30 family transposase